MSFAAPSTMCVLCSWVLAIRTPMCRRWKLSVRRRSSSAELELEGRHVFFRDGWVPYERRQDFLLEADIGVSTHLLHLETAYSFRTRMLDYLWAGLPVVTTTGDGFSSLVVKHGIGRTAPPGDVDALAAALLELLLDEQARQMCITASRRLAHMFEWQKVLEPLVSFCRHPMRAADADATVELDEPTRQTFRCTRSPRAGWREMLAPSPVRWRKGARQEFSVSFATRFRRSGCGDQCECSSSQRTTRRTSSAEVHCSRNE